jgi:hypothetical protein
MREIQRSVVLGGQEASEADRPQFPHELDEEFDPRRYMPAAGIVEVKAAPDRGPTLENDSQFTRIQERPDEGLRNVEKPRASFARL